MGTVDGQPRGLIRAWASACCEAERLKCGTRQLTWFIESSITVREALLHAIWKPFITAMMERPFQSF